MKKKKALITGITGQDGAFLSKFLLEKDYEIYGTVRRISTPNFWRLQHLKILNKVNLISADLSDMASLTKAVHISNPDEIYNLAAQSFVGTSFDQPLGAADINSLGMIRLLEIIKNFNPRIKFYQASTSELYGSSVSSDLSQNENTPFKPNSPYAASKLFAFGMARIYRESYGIFVGNGILFNHESELRGLEFVTRKITNEAVKIKLGLSNELKLGNIYSKRDWGYAPEYVESMWKILQNNEPDDFVIATNETHSIKEFMEEAFNVLGLNWEKYVKIKDYLKRPCEVAYLKGDYSKAKRVLKWEPKTKFSGLVKKMINADLDRWNRYLNGEMFAWDAPNFPGDIDYLTKIKK